MQCANSAVTGLRSACAVRYRLDMATETKARIVPGHRITWWVYSGGYGQPLERIRKTATMRGHWPGYDATCECGWDSKTGGAVKSSVERDVRDHKYDATGDWRQL